MWGFPEVANPVSSLLSDLKAGLEENFGKLRPSVNGSHVKGSERGLIAPEELPQDKRPVKKVDKDKQFNETNAHSPKVKVLIEQWDKKTTYWMVTRLPSSTEPLCSFCQST